jgi:hypothetical protein
MNDFIFSLKRIFNLECQRTFFVEFVELNLLVSRRDGMKFLLLPIAIISIT